MKAVIANGGLGHRLLEITKVYTPKGHISFSGKPLIAHQIQTLAELGIREVAICYTFSYQIDSFNNLVKEGKIPTNIKYKPVLGTFEYHGYSHPYLMFLAQELSDFLKGHPFIKLYSDEMTDRATAAALVEKFNEAKETLLVKYKPRIEQPFIVHSNKDNLITKIEYLGELYWPYNIGGLAIFSEKDQDILFSLKKEEFPHVTLFIKKAMDQGRRLHLIPVHNYINMNTKEDYYDMVKFIEEHFHG